MFNTIKAKNETLTKLKEYNGINPYILKLKRDVILRNKTELLSEFVIEYILTNFKFNPIPINKTVKIADWFGEKLKKDYEIEFLPEKLRIFTLIGETKAMFHVLIKYRQNMEPMEMFISKKAVIENFLIEDYHDFKVDFDRYDMLSSSKDPNRKLKLHQKEAIQFLLSRKKCILADDMGLGKTSSLSVSSIEGNFDSVIIICPASLKTNWRDELLWYVPERDITIIDSPNSMTKPELEKFLGYKEGKSNLTVKELKEEAKDKGKWEDNRFVIVNFDILDEFYQIPKSRSKENIEIAFKNSPMLQYIINKKSLIIIDEAHRLSDNTSMRYKVINDLIKRGKPDSIYLATGTPITNSPQNFYCLLKLIDDPITDDWQYFMDRYCGAMKIPAKGEKERWTNYFLQKVKKNSWYDLTSQEKDKLKEYINENARKITITKESTNLDELKLRVQHLYLRRTKEDIGNSLPTKTIHEVYYNLNSLQKMEYDKLWEEYETAQLEADPTKEINKELLEGAIYRRYCAIQMIPNTIKLAEKLISEGKKVIIATCYDDEINSLKEYFGERAVMYNGKMNIKQKDAAKEAFLTNPNITVFLGNIIAASVGLTLIVSNALLFNSFSYTDAENKQMEDRIYRIGQTKDVDIYYQMFRKTRCEDVWNICLRKEAIANAVIKKEDEK